MSKTSIVVDLCANHNGDLTTAKKMIRLAKKCGANYLKFQKKDPELYSDEYMIVLYLEKFLIRNIEKD